jgi:16S rRNA processing protein RimM
VTVVVPAGDAAHWVDLDVCVVSSPGGATREYEVEEARAYGNRLVLKFRGVDDGDTAERLRGMQVVAPREAAPELDEDEYYRAELVGMEVALQDGTTIGSVADVWPTGGSDLLVVRAPGASPDGDDDVLIPLSREIVPEIDASARRILVAPPPGLLELNQEPGEAAAAGRPRDGEAR